MASSNGGYVYGVQNPWYYVTVIHVMLSQLSMLILSLLSLLHGHIYQLNVFTVTQESVKTHDTLQSPLDPHHDDKLLTEFIV